MTNVQYADSGWYHLLATNPVSSVSSRAAALIVKPPPYEVVALTNHYWHYNQEGNDLGTAWRAVDYPLETNWPAGRGVFAWEDDGAIRPLTNTILSLTAPPPATNRIRTYYFRTTFVLTNDPAAVTLLTSNLFDDGLVVHVTGSRPTGPTCPVGTSPTTRGRWER